MTDAELDHAWRRTVLDALLTTGLEDRLFMDLNRLTGELRRRGGPQRRPLCTCADCMPALHFDAGEEPF